MAIDKSFVNVKINVHGSGVQTIKMQKGAVFENNGGKYVVDENGKLNVFDKNSGTWKAANAIEMKKYQFQAFKAVADNTKEGGQGIAYSKADIKSAMNKYTQGGFMNDMDDFLPSGYKLEKPQKTANSVQVKVTDGNGSGATLKFQIAELADLKKASESYQAQSSNKPSQSNSNTIVRTEGSAKPAAKQVSAEDKAALPTHNGKFYFDTQNAYGSETNGVSKLPIHVGSCALTEAQEKKMFSELKQLNGKSITPELVDKLVNILIKYNTTSTELSYDGESYTTKSMFHQTARFGEYLSSKTIDKLLAEPNFLRVEERHINDVKKLYNRMTPAQKDKYYSRILSKGGNSLDNAPFGDYQADGTTLAKHIFEKPVSSKNFNRLKSLVATMNKKGNGIANTGTECKSLIEALYTQRKITKGQANQLFKAANIKKQY